MKIKLPIINLFILTLVVIGFPTTQTEASTFKNNSECPRSEQLSQNLQSGAYNNRYHKYTKEIVNEAHLLQRHLNRLGFSSGKEDGKLGPISTGAIMRMQKFLGTKPDGFVGPLTRAALNNSCEGNAKTTTTTSNSSFSSVISVDSSFDDIPEVKTHSPNNRTTSSVFFRGELTDIGDADEVQSFFVFAQDAEDIEDIENDYDSYSQIPLPLRVYATDLDEEGSFGKNKDSLTPNQDYFVRACAEFEDYEENLKIVCGNIIETRTLNPQFSQCSIHIVDLQDFEYISGETIEIDWEMDNTCNSIQKDTQIHMALRRSLGASGNGYQPLGYFTLEDEEGEWQIPSTLSSGHYFVTLYGTNSIIPGWTNYKVYVGN